mmetsp:Transcript_11163/g.19642  ORF Transcript_11163/g.19642 Transcript_11163/m.19642 type:complete len:244 (-) Transcript_11163:334-1065(-)
MSTQTEEIAPQGDFVTRLLPAGTQVSFGAVSGAAAGYALRQGGKIAGVLLGTGFVFVQSLAYLGYVEVDWRKIERDYYNVMDANKDGKVTIEDFQLMLSNSQEVLKFNLPAGSGFTAGFGYGISGSAKIALGATAAYGGLTSAALGGFPTDLFTAKGLEQIASNGVGVLKGGLLNTPPVDPAIALEKALLGRSLEDLRVLEYEVKHDLGMSAELMGLQLNGLPKEEVLHRIEDTKRVIKAQRA